MAATESDPPPGGRGDELGAADESAREKTLRARAEKIAGTRKRWGIETWHKVLKSGCKVEDCLLEEAERLKRYLTLFSIIGVRLMHVTYLARVQPDLPATEVFSAEEIEALHVRLTNALPPAEQPRRCARRCACSASLGGHLGRKGDGEPGVTVLWRGWMRLVRDRWRCCAPCNHPGSGQLELNDAVLRTSFYCTEIELIRAVAHASRRSAAIGCRAKSVSV